VAAAWKAGATFDSLAKKHHDFASAEETTLLTPSTAQLPPAYQQGFADKKAKDFVVFQIPGNGTVPAKSSSHRSHPSRYGGDLTLAEVRSASVRARRRGCIQRLMDTCESRPTWQQRGRHHGDATAPASRARKRSLTRPA